ncbi:transposase [Parafilimonas sp.]|uniref:transposase n=1 Tax=Parafilimonas sp. TaxID=1969739 RepID=UPI0039E5E1BE
MQLAELKKIIVGSKGEKFIAAGSNENIVQADMLPDDKLAEHAAVKTTLIKSFEKKQTTLVVKPATAGRHPGRNPLPDSLRREVITLQPNEDVSDLKQVGKEVKEVLEYQPGELYVKQIVRPEYIKPSEDGLTAKRVIAPLPVMPLEKSIAGPYLLTHLLVSKYVDHQPVYRQLEIFKRQNVTAMKGLAKGLQKRIISGQKLLSSPKRTFPKQPPESENLKCAQMVIHV